MTDARPFEPKLVGMPVRDPSEQQTAPISARQVDGESLLILSDVHLGNDINDFPAGSPPRSRAIDDDLARLLAHYRRVRPAGGRWRLVIAGDFIDFIGMTVRPAGERLDTEPSDEERLHGLGNAADHACVKLRRVAARHPDVFAGIAAFVADGNALTLVHGNHDIEFHWDVVKDELRAILLGHARAEAERAGTTLDEASFGLKIDFCPWFYYERDVAYIEHGHQYDAMCATDQVMAPLSPFDPRRIATSFSDVLLRWVVRPTRGLREYGHEALGLVDYIALAARLGLRGGWALLTRFAAAIAEAFRLRRGHFSEAAAALRCEHERRMALLAEATRIGKDRLRALAALQVPPVSRSISGILGSMLLDRLALALACSIALLAVAVVGAYHGHAWYAAACVLVAWGVAHRHLVKQRQLDPAEVLVDRASQLARLFPAAFVVMGHTHIPANVPVNEGAATYINVGSWSEQEPEPDVALAAYRAARTHLVIHKGASGPVAELLTWDSLEGPKRFVSGHP